MIKIYDLVTGYYGKNTGPSISGSIITGSMIAVMGPNGAGKSSFLKTLAGLLPPIAGKLEFKRNNLSISYLPQKNDIDYYFPITVFDVVSMGCWPKINFFKKINYYQQCLIWKALEKVKLIDLMHQCIDSLSGGQIQRMLFARILVQQSSLILLDEPFQGIDNITCEILINAMNQLQKMGCTIITVLHDKRFISRYFSKVLVLTQSTSVWKESKGYCLQ